MLCTVDVCVSVSASASHHVHMSVIFCQSATAKQKVGSSVCWGLNLSTTAALKVGFHFDAEPSQVACAAVCWRVRVTLQSRRQNAKINGDGLPVPLGKCDLRELVQLPLSLCEQMSAYKHRALHYFWENYFWEQKGQNLPCKRKKKKLQIKSNPF